MDVFSAVQAGTCDLTSAEDRIRGAALGFAARMVGEIMSGPLQKALGVDLPAGRREKRSCRILSSVGHLDYTRWYARSAAGERTFPADDALRIISGCTPCAVQRLCQVGALSPSYTEASRSLETLAGIQASSNTIQRLTGIVGPAVKAWAQRRAPATVQPGRDVAVCLQMDMTGVRLRKKYLKEVKGKKGEPKCRQIKVGVVFLLERCEDGLYHKVPDSSVHILSFDDVVDFASQLEKARKKLGVKASTKQLIISDGAEWIWNIAKDRFKQAIGILDFWHAAEHLSELCSFACAKTDDAAEYFTAMRHTLKHKGVDAVIKHFEQLDVSRRKRKGIEKRLGYFRTHQDRMQYPLYQQDGWPIGSGEIEGACKSLIKQRTDLSGQRWSPDGALNVLWVRALIKDGLYELYWEQTRTKQNQKTAA